jgi:hypothetical protein
MSVIPLSAQAKTFSQRLFNETFYLSNNPDVLQAVSLGLTTAFEHFSTFGHRENRPLLPFFNTQAYLTANSDVANATTQPGWVSAWNHFVLFGILEGRSPNGTTGFTGLFDNTKYLAQNPDVNTAVSGGAFRNGFEHYLLFGAKEGRAAFDKGGNVIDFQSSVTPGKTFTLTTGQDYADSTSSFRNNGLLSSDFKFTSQSETIAAGAGTLNDADALIDPSTSDNDVLNATLTALVAPTLQNIETINLTIVAANKGLDMANVTGAKTVTLTGGVNGTITNIDATAAPTIEVKNYTKVATLQVATLAGTNDALTVKVSGMTGSATVTPGITLNATNSGALETLNLVSAGTTKNTVDLVKTANVSAVNKTVVTGAADLDLRVGHALITGKQLDASGHTGALNLIVDRNGATTIKTDLTNVSGYDVLTVRDSVPGGDELRLKGVTTGSTVVLANAFPAGAASIEVKDALSNINDTLTLVLKSTDGTNIDVNGNNTLTISNIETLTIKSEGGTSTGNTIQKLDVTVGTNLVVDGGTKLTLGLEAGSKVSTITLQGAGNHEVKFNGAATYSEGKNLTIDGSAATGKLTIDMSNFKGNSFGVNEKLTITGSAQDDTITTGVAGDQTVVIDGGAGNDTITVAIAGATNSKTTITTGAGADTIKVDLTGINAAARITVTDFKVGSGGDVFSTKGALTSTFTFDNDNNDMGDNELFVYTVATINGTGIDGVLKFSDLSAFASPINNQKSLLIVLNDATGFAEMYYYQNDNDTVFSVGDTLVRVATFENITTLGVLDGLVAANFAVFT